MIHHVNVRGVPYEMSIVDGCVLFSDKAGFCAGAITGRFLWVFVTDLWYLDCAEDTFGRVAGCHLVRMHELLKEKIGGEHERFEMKFKGPCDCFYCERLREGMGGELPPPQPFVTRPDEDAE